MPSAVAVSEKDVFRLSVLRTIPLLSPKVLLDNCRGVGCPNLHLLGWPSHLAVGEAALLGLLHALGTVTSQFRRVTSDGSQVFAIYCELWDEAGREESLLSVLKSSSELQMSSSAWALGMVRLV